MSENVTHIHDNPLFRCTSVKKTDADRKSDGFFNFNKRKKKDGKKGEKGCSVPVTHNGQKAGDDLHGVKCNESGETHAEENQCGKIIDVEV